MAYNEDNCLKENTEWFGTLIINDYSCILLCQKYMSCYILLCNRCLQVDVFSFGVLVCEMCIQELPDPERRDQQIAMVTNRLLRALIRRCLQSDPEARPNMEEIIEELEEPV